MAEQDPRLAPAAAIDLTGIDGLREIPHLAQVNLRGNGEDLGFMSAVMSVIGADLPTRPNRCNPGTDVKALWLSPDEWLIVGADGKQHDLVWKLEKALEGQHVAINDLSANRTVFELSGPHAATVLMKSCEVDFHPRVFKNGDCVQTLIAKSQAIIEQADAGVFHIYVRCSFSRYVGGWLKDSLLEYQD